MRIVIDLQGAQASNSKRGIGRYCLSLVQSLVRQRGNHEVIIALSDLFPETIVPIRKIFDGLLEPTNIRVWNAPGPVNAFDPDHDSRRLSAELIRESFLATLEPDLVLVGSLFEGGDDAVTSIGRLSKGIHTAVILYDLIPLIHSDIYLKNPIIDRWYKNKIEHLRRADLLLSISESSGREAINHLGIDAKKISVISTAADATFQPGFVDDNMRLKLNRKYGLTRPFVMYTGGIDHRKNIEGLILAYAQLSEDIRAAHQLAIVCFVQDADRERLLKIASNAGLFDGEVILTGFVSEEDLLLCYRACKLFVFPSWHEGFGLPALEAMQCGKAVIAGNTSSLPEVVGRHDVLFNPFEVASITEKIQQVLVDDNFRKELEMYGVKQAAKFNWDATAIIAWQAMEASINEKSKLPASLTVKPRLAYFSPLPPEASGISDYSAELLPELSRYYEVEVIIAQNAVSDEWVNANCEIRSVSWFQEHALEFDRIIYHFGNSNFHDHMFPLLLEYPGVVVLHDFFLSGAISWREITGEIPHYWTRALLESHGWAAVEQRCKRPDTPNVVYEYPCNYNVLQEALGVITHADYSAQLAREWYGEHVGNEFRKIPLLRKAAPHIDVEYTRRALNVDLDEFVVCSFGLLGAPKLNHRLLRAWLLSPFTQDPRCRLVFVGQQSGEYGAALDRVIREDSNGRRIEITGWADDKTYRNWLAAADVGVQLRALSRGETSAAVLDCMNYGLPTIVNANGSMSELDKSAVIMLPDDFSDRELVHALTELWESKQLRADLSFRARQIVRTAHDPNTCAKSYFDAIEEFYEQSKTGISCLLEKISKHAATLQDHEMQLMADCIDKNSVPFYRSRRLLIDVSDILHSENERINIKHINDLLLHWLRSAQSDLRVELIYESDAKGCYRYARNFTCELLGIQNDWVKEEVVAVYAGDIFFGFELQKISIFKKINYLKYLRRNGVGVYLFAMNYIKLIEAISSQDPILDQIEPCLEIIAIFDGFICSNRSKDAEIQQWLKLIELSTHMDLGAKFYQIGNDFQSDINSNCLPEGLRELMSVFLNKSFEQ